MSVISDFLDQLQPASWNSVNFYVSSSDFSGGRRIAPHEFPFSDTFYFEDMGLGMQKCRFTGFLVGNDTEDVFSQRDGLLSACNTKGAGTLVHPSLGTATANLTTYSFSEDVKSWNYIAVSMEFLIQTGSDQGTQTSADTSSDIDDSCDDLDDSSSGDFIDDIANASANVASFVTSTISDTVGGFIDLVTPYATDAASILNAVQGVNYLFNSSWDLGRYIYGNLTSIPNSITNLLGSSLSSTVLLSTATDQMLAADTTNRQSVLAAAAMATASLASGTSQLPYTVQALTESLRLAASPTDAVRVISNLASYAPTTISNAGIIQQAIAGTTDTISAVCRRAALSSLGRACGNYQPTSSTDAKTILATVIPLYDAEINIASASNDSNTLAALKRVKVSVIADMNAKASNLQTVVTVNLPTSLPLLKVAMQLYGDASRYNEILQRNQQIACPLFSGTSIEVLK